jgi:putative methionine-R-sulfoxide reductase with GAF domain
VVVAEPASVIVLGAVLGPPVHSGAMPRSPVGPRKAAAERLRDIESVIDARLARLDVEELLVELLDRVRDALDADTAAILLLDEPTGQLVATAARGLEAEVRQGVRIPLGRGFAGRIAATRRPVRVEDIDEADVVNPILRETGIRSLLGVPLLAGGRLLGVLHVGTLVPRRFSEADVELMQVVAERVALATHVRVSDIERNAARILQRSLLPERLPDIEGLETAFRYIAGDEGDVGGDWYDMFVLPSGRVCVTVGDVVGRGLRAAAVMGRLRNTVHAYALDDDGDPAAILERVDGMVRHFQPGEMATVALGLFEPSLERLHLSTAGHPAPVVAGPDGPATYLDLPVDPPLGVVDRARRRVTAVDVPPGGVLCFYTDGLIERRDVPLDDRVRQLTRAVVAEPPDQVCARVMASLIGPETSSDDVAILVLRRLRDGAPDGDAGGDGPDGDVSPTTDR